MTPSITEYDTWYHTVWHLVLQSVTPGITQYDT